MSIFSHEPVLLMPEAGGAVRAQRGRALAPGRAVMSQAVPAAAL